MIKFNCNSCDGIYNSLDVRFSKACDNNCSFCIEQNGKESLGKTDVRKMIEKTINLKKDDVLILGGEPLLQPKKVLQYIKGIRGHIGKIYLTTSLPLEVLNYPNEFNEIMRLLDGINISVHHYNSDKNNKVLNSTKPYNRIKALKFLLKENDNFKKKHRICCNLCNGSIDSKEEILNFLVKMKNIGVTNIKLNELQNVDSKVYCSFDKLFNSNFKSPFSHGCQTNISKYMINNYPELQGLNITLKRSCFIVQESSSATLADAIKCIYKRFFEKSKNNFHVLYENGMISNHWIKERSDIYEIK